MLDKPYWDAYYSRTLIREPSAFAHFCSGFCQPSDVIIDAGCGSGRDTYYFGTTNRTMGVDSSEAVRNFETSGNPLFLQADVCAALPFLRADVVYARWLLHALNDEQLASFASALTACIGPGGLFLAEFRSENEPAKNFDHFRKYRSVTAVAKLLEDARFRIVYAKESFGWSKMGDDDPCLIRIVAEMK